MDNKERIVKLLSALISIPSYVSESTNENAIADYITSYIKSLGFLDLEKQQVIDGRYNIVASDGSKPKLAFVCHMDTVPASTDWDTDPLNATVKDGFVYGLGACDMKGGIASLLDALKDFKKTDGLLLVFDIDEEYYLRGMTKFADECNEAPELAILPEPGLAMRRGHRGVVEVKVEVKGVSAHAAKPSQGKSASLGMIRIISNIENELRNYSDEFLGNSVLNVASINAGLFEGRNAQGSAVLSEKANKIPDFAEALIEIRNAKDSLNASELKQIVEKAAESEGVQVIGFKTMLDRGTLNVDRKRLTVLEKAVEKSRGKLEYADPGTVGYGEGQILYAKTGTPCVYFGPGPNDRAHKANERVAVSELMEARKIFSELIRMFCKDEKSK